MWQSATIMVAAIKRWGARFDSEISAVQCNAQAITEQIRSQTKAVIIVGASGLINSFNPGSNWRFALPTFILPCIPRGVVVTSEKRRGIAPLVEQC